MISKALVRPRLLPPLMVHHPRAEASGSQMEGPDGTSRVVPVVSSECGAEGREALRTGWSTEPGCGLGGWAGRRGGRDPARCGWFWAATPLPCLLVGITASPRTVPTGSQWGGTNPAPSTRGIPRLSGTVRSVRLRYVHSEPPSLLSAQLRRSHISRQSLGCPSKVL